METATPQIPAGKFCYGQWNLDKPKEPGFSHELISSFFDQIKDKTTVDELKDLPFPGVDTLLKAFQKNVKEMPEQELLGTNNGKSYDWLTFKQVDDIARDFAAGVMALDLAPEVEGEGTQWRFLGIQAKNRKEWGLTHIGNMRNNVTSITLYDTLGEDASKYVINQTGLTTIACQGDLVAKILQMKIDDKGEKIGHLKNLVTFDKREDMTEE